jgi:restriction system protein
MLAPDAAECLAKYCESSPQIASVLLKRLKTHGYHEVGYVSLDTASAALRTLGYQNIAENSRDLIKNVRAMSAIEFEQFVADVFHRNGYSAELTATTGDHGIDIILRKPGRMVVVQCKQWDGTIGEPVLREFYGSMVAAHADAGFVVTTSNFTSQAEVFVRNKPIELYNIDSIVALYLKTGKSASGWDTNGLWEK